MVFLNILLCILKIIGIVILAVLGIVLLLLCLLLFVPIRYTVNASYHEKPRVAAHVTYLLRLLHVQFDLDGKESELKIKIFGHNISKADAPADDKEEPKSDKSKSDKPEGGRPQGGKKETGSKTDDKQAKNSRQLVKTTEAKAEHDRPPVAKPADSKPANVKVTTTTSAVSKPADNKPADNKKSKAENADGGSDRIVDKIKAVAALLKANKPVLKFVFKQVKLLFKHILPGSHVINIRLGLDDPATLGEILGAVAVLRAMTGLVINISPVWDGKVFEAEATLKGRIVLGRILFIAARVYFNKEVRKLINTVKNSR